MLRKPQSHADSIARLRRKITIPFFIRGTARSFSLSNSASLDRKTPAYFVQPLYKMDSKEWLSRLHATVNAAVYRGISHGKDVARYDWSGKRVQANQLPAILVWGGGYPGSGRTFQKRRRIYKVAGHPTLKFDIDFRHRKPEYEKGIVQGKARPAFTESTFTGGAKIDQIKLFEVRMTVPEFRQIIKDINAKLQGKGGPNLRELNKRYVEALRSRDAKKEEKIWQVALEASKRKQFQFTEETTPRNPAEYLFYLEACKLLTDKFTKKGVQWLEQNTTKK